RGDNMAITTYTFKEICDKTGYKSSVIRYYEKEFNLSIPRDVNGRRYFTQKDLDKLLYIKRLQDEGFSNSQIKKHIQEGIYCTSEIAVSADTVHNNSSSYDCSSDFGISKLEEKLTSIEKSIEQLNEAIFSKERDLIISENMKLKMELKQKSYELFEIKEKLRYEKEKKRGFFSKLFNRK
ncbi:hypothetical protein Q428_14600, partial [Fervidicella metallireducens AeB]